MSQALKPRLSQVLRGLENPREALLYVTLGRQRYLQLRQETANTHTCYLAHDLTMPFASLTTFPTDIHEHLVTLYMLTVEFNYKTVVELGTRDGQSTTALLYAVKKVGGRLHSFDVDTCSEAKNRVTKLGLEDYWEFKQTNDLEAAWSEPIDHLFIDTSHTYEHTVKELQKYEPYLKEGGVVTMHDFVTWPDIWKAVNTYFKGRQDIRMYEYPNNNGLLVIFKGY